MMNNAAAKLMARVGWILFILVLSACHPGIKEEPKKVEALKAVKPRHYPDFLDSLDYRDLGASIDQSLSYFKRVPLDRVYRYGKDSYTAGHMIWSLETFKAFLETRPSQDRLQKFIESNYRVYTATGNADGQVLYTGYFEPTYPGARQKSADFQFPLFSKPDDLLEINLADFSDKYRGHKKLMARVHNDRKRVVPYYSRSQINAIEDFYERAQPVVWLKSRVDRFFLEIQGSGRIDLGNGEIMRVGYAGSNGNAYRSIGRYLIEKDEILKENMSMQAIRTWLEFNPEKMDEVLHYNNSFVFFNEAQGGPYGSIGVQVTPMRSIATDSRLFPKGGLCFVQGQLPDRKNINPIKQWENASFFCLNQDTGGAIKGPARADIFCGNDNYATFTAGNMNIYGRLYFLVRKAATD